MTVSFLTGFESGDLLEASATAGSPAIDSGVKRTGGWSLKCASVAAAEWAQFTGWDAQGLINNLSNATMYYSFWLYVPTGGDPLVAAIPIADMRIGGNAGIRLFLSTTGTLQLTYINGSDVETNIGSAVALTHDAWQRIEMRGTLTSTGGSSSAEWRLNGSSQATGTSLTIRSSPGTVRGIRLGGGATETFTAQYDDVIGATTEAEGWPGAGEVRLMYPDADSAVANWASGTGTTFAEVDEVQGTAANDGDTTYLKTSTSGTQHRCTLISSAAAGITGTIAAVQAEGIVRRDGLAGNMNLRFRGSGSTNADTTSGDPGASFVILAGILVVDPDTGVAFTTTDLDSAQIGVLANNSVGFRWTAGFAQVYCVPPAAGGKGPLLNGGRLINGGITAGRLVA